MATLKGSEFELNRIIRPHRGKGRVGYFYDFVSRLDEYTRLCNFLLRNPDRISEDTEALMVYLREGKDSGSLMDLERSYLQYVPEYSDGKDDEIKFCSFLYNRYHYNAHLVRPVVKHKPRVLLLGDMSDHYEQVGSLLSAFLNQGIDYISIPLNDSSLEYTKSVLDRVQSLSDYPWNLLGSNLPNFFSAFDKIIFINSAQSSLRSYQVAFNKIFSAELNAVAEQFMRMHGEDRFFSSTLTAGSPQHATLNLTDEITKQDNKYIVMNCNYSLPEKVQPGLISDWERLAYIAFHKLLKSCHPELYLLF